MNEKPVVLDGILLGFADAQQIASLMLGGKAILGFVSVNGLYHGQTVWCWVKAQ